MSTGPVRPLSPLVALSSFVGRRNLLETVRERLLGAARLVTLIGVGGAGKTRLALEAARRAAGDADQVDRVHLVELAPLESGGDVEDVARAVLAAVEGPDQSVTSVVDTLAAVVSHVGDSRVLLVLDNCERLVDQVGVVVATLLRESPGLRVLATSREALHIGGEHVVAVPPLDVPPEGAPMSVDYDAVRLLVDRAEAGVPGWRLTPEDWPHVVRVLSRTAGLPLAVELVVARMRALPLSVLADRLDDAMRVLTRNDSTILPHHRTLEAAVQWSYDWCTPAEQMLWARLSVLEGDFTLAAAEDVAGEGLDPVEVADTVTGLVDKSVLLPSPDRRRYRLLEPLRQFGVAVLRRRDGELDRVTARYLEHYRGCPALMMAQWNGRNELQHQAELTEDWPHYRALLARLLHEPTAEDGVTALALAVDLVRTRWYFSARRLPEGRSWLRRARAAVPPTEAVALQAGALAGETWLSLCLGAPTGQVEALLAEADELAARTGGPVAPVTFAHGVYRLLGLADPASIDLLSRAEEQFAALGAAFSVDRNMAQLLRALAAALVGEERQARRWTEEFDADMRELGAPWGMSWATCFRGVTETRFGDAERAVDILTDALRQQQATGDQWAPIWGIEALARASARLGDATRTARLLGIAHQLHTVTGVRVSGLRPFAQARADSETAARAVLGDTTFGQLYEVQVGSVDQAVRLALTPHRQGAPAGAQRAKDFGLTPRQWDCAVLAADGLTNRQIADRLGIELRTVESHLGVVYQHRSLANRVALTRWIAEVTTAAPREAPRTDS